MKRFINWIKVILSIIVLAIFTVTCFGVLSKYFRDEAAGERFVLKSFDENSLDVVALGSSQMQYSFSPEIFKEMTGFNSMVFGSGCQNFSVTLAAMKTIFETQNPSVIFVDVFTATQEAHNACYTDEMVYSGSLLMDDQYRIDALQGIKDNNSEKYQDFVFDLSFNHNKWKDLKLDKNEESKDSYGDFFGYIYKSFEKDYTYTPVYIYDVTQVSQPNELITSYLDQMIELCNQHNTELVLVKVPADLPQEDQALVRGILKYGASKGVKTLNLIDKAEEIGWFFNRDGDTYHNNVWGAYKVTSELANFMQNEFSDIQPKQMDKSMNQNYRKALNPISLELIKYNDDIYRVMEIIDNLNMPTLLIYKSGSRNNMLENDYAALDAIGFDSSLILNNQSTVQLVDANGKLIDLKLTIESIDNDLATIEILNDKLIYGEKEYYFNQDNFILFTFQPDLNQGTLASVDTIHQIYFWNSACYEKPCAFSY